MWSLLVLLGLGAIAPFGKDGLPVAPVDIEPGRQVVALRKPLHARSAGAYLILYVRDRRPGSYYDRTTNAATANCMTNSKSIRRWRCPRCASSG